MELRTWKLDNPTRMETRRRTTSRRTAGATAICILIALFACAWGHRETVPHVRLVLVERSRSIAGSRTPDTSVVDASVGDSGGRDYAIRLLTKGRAGSQSSGLWHDRYSKDFPALGDPVDLDAPAVVVRQVQAACTDSLAARHMQVNLFMWVLVSKEGTVLATRSFDNDSLAAASADACVRQWTYRPARCMGNPVASWLSTNVEVCQSPPRGGR